MVSSEMEEVLGLSDRVVVMRERRIDGILPAASCTPERIGRADDRRAPKEETPHEARARHVRGPGPAVPRALWPPTPTSSGASNVVNTTRQISMLGIFAIGIAFVIITGGIDLSIGSVIGLTGVLIAKLSGQSSRQPAAGGLGYSLWVGIPVALGGGAALVGLAQGLLITRLKLQPFIVTLGGMLLLRGVSQTIVEGGTLSLGDVAAARAGERRAVRLGGDPLLPYPFLILAGGGRGRRLRAALHRVRPLRLRDRRQPRGGASTRASPCGASRRSTYVISAGSRRRRRRLLRRVHRPDVAAGRRSPTSCTRSRRPCWAACSLRGGEGTVLGIVIGSCDHARHRQRHQHVPVGLPRRRRRRGASGASTPTGRSSSSAP